MMANESTSVLNQARTVEIRGAGLPPGGMGQPMLRFQSLDGRERMGELFTYEVILRTPNDTQVPLSVSANLDLTGMIGKELTVVILLSDGSPREISGLVVKAGFVRQEGDHNLYRVTLRPWLWLATLTSDYKIFQDQSAVQIIDQVLADYPYPVEKRLDIEKYAIQPESDANEPRNFQVQYGETDFDFIQRLMEEWGIYWFFEHTEGTHRLVLCDHVGAHRAPDSAAYQHIPMHAHGGHFDCDVFRQFGVDERLFPGRVVVDDFDFTRPRMQLVTSSHQPRQTSWAEGEIYEWPGDYTDAKHGALISRVRMEERRARGVRSRGFGNVRGLAVGQTFNLTGHLYEKANREYLTLASQLSLSEIPEEAGTEVRYDCVNELEVQPTDEVFRMPRLTAKPVVSGPQSAIVVGPEGKEVWTDEFGRVKVRFLWDRYARNDASDSCWVRVNQAWAGSNFGGMYIPRIGQEVVVGFMNGDPDRPLILGGLYNSVTRPPWDLPAEATKSGIKTRSLEGGKENYNGIRFEDKPGGEEFYVQAERDMVRLTKGAEQHTVALTYGQAVGINHSTAVGGMLSSMVGGTASYNVGLAQTTQVGGLCGLNVGGAYAVNVGAAANLNVGAGYLVNAGAMIAITCGKAGINMLADGTITLIGTSISVVGSGEVAVQGNPLQLNPGTQGSTASFGLGAAVPPVFLPTIALPVGGADDQEPVPTPPPPTQLSATVAARAPDARQPERSADAPATRPQGVAAPAESALAPAAPDGEPKAGQKRSLTDLLNDATKTTQDDAPEHTGTVGS